MVEDKTSLLIGLLSILKSGNCVVPINPIFPNDRIRFIVEDCRIEAILTDRANHDRVLEVVRGSSCLKHVICINEADFESQSSARQENEESRGKAVTARHHPHLDQPCYLIYTSGSTGKPKGVQITYRNLVPLLSWFHGYFKLGKHIKVLQNLSYTFDFGIFELITTLLCGGGLFFLDRKMLSGLDEYVDFIHRHQIDTIHTTPSFFSDVIALGRSLSPLQLLHFGGERLTGKIVEEASQLVGADCYIYNGYGPTETTINSTIYSIQARVCRGNRGSPEPVVPPNIPIGKPSANNIIYILDTYENLQPLGVVGELYIGGAGVAGGYLNNPELTAEKFISLFNKSTRSYFSRKFYKTGDLVRWLPEGNVEFLGRIDYQVKIRGFRIELGEIENRLLEYPSIKEAAVMDRRWENQETYLCAYIVPGEDFEVGGGIKALKEFLSGVLPDYMVPSAFVTMERMPLNPNKKTDRKALPLPVIGMGEEQYIPPRSRTEETLVALWSEVLGIEKTRIGIDGNFFELGGHSLKATTLASRTYKVMDVKIPLVEIFKSPTIRQLARYIEASAKERYQTINPVEKREYYQLSPAQRRLYLLYGIDSKSLGYNIPTVMELEGDVQKERLEKVFRQSTWRYESFRTSFLVVEEGPVQVIHDEVEFEIEYYDLRVTGAGDRCKWEEAPFGQISNAFGDQYLKSQELRAKSCISSFIRPFDLSKAPLLRVGLVRLPAVGSQSPAHFLLMVDMHHIIADGTSMNVLIDDFAAFYYGEGLPPLVIQYKDFSRWQNSKTQKEMLEAQEKYWLKTFDKETPVLDMPLDFPRPVFQDFTGNTIKFILGEAETAKLNALAIKQETTLFMVLFAVFTLMLAKLSGQEEIVVGTPVAGRRHVQLEKTIGMFINTLAVRSFLPGWISFKGFLKEVKLTTLAAFENQDYPFEELVEKIDVKRDTSRNPLFDVMFALQNMDSFDIQIPGLKIVPYPYESRVSKFDFTLIAIEINNHLEFTFEYCTVLFKEETIRRFIGYFTKTISTVIDNHDIRISGIEIIDREEKKRILYDFNDTEADYPKDKTIHRLFEEQVKKRPHRVALVGGGGADLPVRPVQLTYSELNERSGKLEELLIKKGVQPDTIVGIRMQRSIEMIIGILGILKAGGAYLPIDPDYPEERKKYMLSDSSARLLVDESFFTPAEEGPSDHLSALLPERRGFPEFLGNVYIIYTSGSTGTPKGVPIRERGFVNLVHWYVKEFELNADDRYLLIAPIGFDLAQKNIFAPLMNGGCLCLGSPGLPDYDSLSEFIASQQLTVINCAPTVFYPFLELNDADGFGRLKSLRYVFLGGEPIQGEKLLPWLKSDVCKCEIVNTYGPTECTDVVSYYRIPDVQAEHTGTIPLGRPIDNVTLYVLDRRQSLLPVKVAGELCIGGGGVAQGYLNRPELTAEKFNHDFWDYQDYHDENNQKLLRGVQGEAAPPLQEVPSGHLVSRLIAAPNSPVSFDPSQHLAFSIRHSPARPTGRRRQNLYKTGDLARWLSDGNIEFLGRMDQQVKIRGFRIELGEIESRLSKHPGIKGAVVSVQEEENGDKYLCAYFVSDSEYEISGLQEYLSIELPDYMIPSYFVPLEKIPLTPNGKIDRKALPKPGLKTGESYTAPGGDIEKRLVDLWSEILGIDASHTTQLRTLIGIHDNFFRLGGHSLKAAVMVSKIQKNFGVKIEIQTIFRFPTIAGIAGVIKSSQIIGSEEIEKLPEQPYYEMSYAQKRLWYIYRSNPRDTAFNMPAKWTFFEPVDAGLTRKVLERLMIRHESLRTSFKEVKEGSVQVIEPQEAALSKLNFDVLDLSRLDQTERENQRTRLLKEESSHIFNLEEAPHFRARLIKCGEEEYDIIINIHHIAADGWSLDIFKKEFLQVYESYKKGIGCELEPLKIQYKDYAAWQNRQLKDEEKMGQAKEFWKNYLKDSITALNLRYDFSSKPLGTKKSSAYYFLIEASLAERLRLFAGKQKVSLFIVLLAAFNILLSHISNQDNILVGIPAAARQHWSLKNIIGLFVNTLILQSKVNAKETFIDFLNRFRTDAFNVLEYQDYPLEIIFGELKIKYPEISAFFNMVNIGTISEECLKNFKSYHSEEVQETKFPIHCYLIEYKNGIRMECHYFRELFRPATIEKIMQIYTRILENLSASPLKKIKELTRKIEKIPG